MKNSFLILLLTMLILAGCSPALETTPLPPTSTPTEVPNTGNADVRFVRAEKSGDGTWNFTVTVEHPDTGWDDYADGWDVVLPDGTVVKTSAGGPFTRLLTHPHENEKPFTRSQSGIIIPEGISQVTVRAHDLVDGFGGQEVIVFLDQASGLNFEVISPIELQSNSFAIGVTYLQSNGNRYIPGKIDLPNTQPTTISLPAKPLWIVGIDEDEILRWLVALEDGKLFIIEQVETETKTVSLSRTLPPGTPIALTSGENGGILFQDNASSTSHPIMVETGDQVWISTEGELILSKSTGDVTVKVNALPDARILSDGQRKFLVLTDPTNEYAHAVLGDGLEAKSATVVTDTGDISAKILAPTGMVFEAIMPIWTDINQDGTPEIIFTASNAEIGAQILIYNLSGEIISKSQPIGTGYRWRNQAAVAPFGPNGEMELVNVITPHLLGKVEFLQLNGDRLERVAEISGYTSHVIGTRNLDMFLSADLDADGQAEVLIPTQDLKALGIIEHSKDGASIIAELPLNGPLSSNLAGIGTSGGLAIAAGTADGTLYLWLP
jgi:hypothetical protein